MKSKNPGFHRTCRKKLTHKATRKFGRLVRWFNGHLTFVDTGKSVPGIPAVSKPFSKTTYNR